MIGTTLAVDRDLKTVKVCLVTDVGDLFCLAALNEICDVVDDRFNARGIRDLSDLDEIFSFIYLILGSY